MPGPSDNQRRSVASAIQWSSRITTLAMSMALPPLLGYWLDNRWKTSPWLTVVLAGFGFAAGISQLVRMSKELGSKSTKMPRGDEKSGEQKPGEEEPGEEK